MRRDHWGGVLATVRRIKVAVRVVGVVLSVHVKGVVACGRVMRRRGGGADVGRGGRMVAPRSRVAGVLVVLRLGRWMMRSKKRCRRSERVLMIAMLSGEIRLVVMGVMQMRRRRSFQ